MFKTLKTIIAVAVTSSLLSTSLFADALEIVTIENETAIARIVLNVFNINSPVVVY